MRPLVQFSGARGLGRLGETHLRAQGDLGEMAAAVVAAWIVARIRKKRRAPEPEPEKNVYPLF